MVWVGEGDISPTLSRGRGWQLERGHPGLGREFREDPECPSVPPPSSEARPWHGLLRQPLVSRPHCSQRSLGLSEPGFLFCQQGPSPRGLRDGQPPEARGPQALRRQKLIPEWGGGRRREGVRAPKPPQSSLGTNLALPLQTLPLQKSPAGGPLCLVFKLSVTWRQLCLHELPRVNHQSREAPCAALFPDKKG